ncbi:MAG: prephenate dehydrogenase [Gammaproteobacteria bacterium]
MSPARLAVIGVGSIGGSFARALRAAGAVREVVGFGLDRADLERARALGVIDAIAPDPAAAVAGRDLVVIAVPVGAVRDVLGAIAPSLPPAAIITDVGSVKTQVVADARAVLGAAFARFVPGHPIAGTERSGVDASDAAMFSGRRVLLTPVADTARGAVETVAAAWRLAGAHVEEMEPQRHDAILAATSHLPHVLAFAFVDCMLGIDESRATWRHSGGGFRDLSRIAASSVDMWHDILTANREPVLDCVDRYRSALGHFAQVLRSGDGSALRALLERARAARVAFSEDSAVGD